ncbi:putative leucine-rich repeat-containing protein DDB_G0290503 isoform X2 [Ruditapes philippinarum]|uniref:putative leucine-rich repeat-containing protein DDB_G0290503 isoform X2 n=1 Tax=Ruditapes philippinarum TaxID=129788 RepID=UPI00295C16C8|nr:putative leucine-rich repeat-containing protein DDB_G0290503 isoform X2 [Ruditapes philippinarum]
MGAKQSSNKGNIEDALKFFEDEVKKWDDNIKNLKESWEKKDRSWVPEYLEQQMDETETRWTNIRTLILTYKRGKYHDNPTNLPSCCKETTRQIQAQLTQMKKNNDTLVNNLQVAEEKINEQRRTIETLQKKISTKYEIRDVDNGTKDEDTPSSNHNTKVLQQSAKHFEEKSSKVADNENSTHIPSKTDEQQKAGSQKLDEKTTPLLLKMNDQETHVKDLENENKETSEKCKYLKKEVEKHSEIGEKQENNDKQNEIEQTDEELKNLRKQYKDMDSELNEKKKRCEELEIAVAQYKDMEVKKKAKKGKTKKEHSEFVENLQRQIKQMEESFKREKLKVMEECQLLQAKYESLEYEFKEQKKEKDSLLLRLSKIAGERLTKDNSAITDLSDPNRPTKLGEVYSELYDNQWTDAFEALKNAGHEEQFAIETLALTLQHVMQFCKSNAELLLKKSSDAVNLMFEGEKSPENEKKLQSHATMQPNQGKKVAHVLRQQSMEEIKFQQERWMARSKDNPGNIQPSTRHVQIGDEAKVDVNSKLKQLIKEMATYMVPVLQKAYMELYWSKGYIEGLKPFILECIFISWMMIVQSPPMTLHTCEPGSRFDKNFYREYMTSGHLVSYMVWPALLLDEGGALVCKGVAEGTKVQTEKK